MKLEKGMIDKFPIAKGMPDIFVKTRGGEALVRVRCDDVAWIGLEDGKTVLHLMDSRTLQLCSDFLTISQNLPQEVFILINRTEIINIHLVNTIIGNTLMIGSHEAIVDAEFRKSAFACFQTIR